MDIADATQRSLEVLDKHAEQNIRAQAAAMSEGDPGECIECGVEKSRLIRGLCGGCRDELDALKIKY